MVLSFQPSPKESVIWMVAVGQPGSGQVETVPAPPLTWEAPEASRRSHEISEAQLPPPAVMM